MHLIRRAPTTAFFVLAYVFGWIFSLPNLLTETGAVHFKLPPFAGGMLFQLAPATAAIIVAAVVSGAAGTRALLARMFIWRVGAWWYAAAAGLPFLVQILAILAFVPLGRPAPQLAPNVLMLFVLLPIGFCTTMGEEIGWRGFALPRLQACTSALASAVVVGVLWGFWHLPPTVLGFMRGTDTLASFLLATVLVVGLSVLVTWIFNNSRGSLLLAALFHTCYNAKGHLLVVPQQPGTFGPKGLANVSFVAIAVLVTVVAGAEHLSRRAERVRDSGAGQAGHADEMTSTGTKAAGETRP